MGEKLQLVFPGLQSEKLRSRCCFATNTILLVVEEAKQSNFISKAHFQQNKLLLLIMGENKTNNKTYKKHKKTSYF